MKKFLSLLFIALLSMSMSAKKVWVDVSAVPAYGSQMSVQYLNEGSDTWNTVPALATTVKDLYYAEIDDAATKWQTCHIVSLIARDKSVAITYADNNLFKITSWSESPQQVIGELMNVPSLYYIAGNGDGNWLGGAEWSATEEGNAITTTTTFTNCPEGIKIFRIVSYAVLDTLHGYTEVTSCNVPYITNGDNNIVFATNKPANITIGFDGTHITILVENTDGTDPLDAIMSGDYVMFYFGDHRAGEGTKYLYTSGWTDDLYYSAQSFTTRQVSQKEYYIAIGVAHKGVRYYVSGYSESTGVQMAENVCQGVLYQNWNYNIEDFQEAFPSAIPTIQNKTVEVGTIYSGMEATATENHSVMGEDYPYSYTYYYTQDDGATWTEFDPADVSGLAAGEYTVHALTHDGHIYLSSDPGILTIMTTNGLENVFAGKKAVKAIENGQMVICIDGVRYNVLGVEMK